MDSAPPSADVPLATAGDRVNGRATAELSRVHLSFDGRMQILQDINFSLREGEFLSIVGPSGCGKSTILRLISNLIKPTSGSVRTFGPDGSEAHVGLMFQRDALLPWADVNHNIAVGLECSGVQKEKHATRIAELLELLGLKEFGSYYPRALSGGMRQRVALGRLLAYDPDVMLMDEPFGALDAQTKILLGYELMRIWTTYRKSVVFVTHDIEEAIGLSDRVLVMSTRPGRIKSEYRVDLPRPRDLRSVRKLPEFHRLSELIWGDIVERM